MLGILSFLVQWLALSHVGSQHGSSFSQHSPSNSHQFSSPPKSHWTLLSEFYNLPQGEIEGFLPQICNILLDRDPKEDIGLYEHFERILIDKCAGCLTFGMRVCSLLKVHNPMKSCLNFSLKISFIPNCVAKIIRVFGESFFKAVNH